MMFEPIQFRNEKGINQQKLKQEIQRRIQKISDIISKRKRKTKRNKKGSSKSSSKIITTVDIAIQTICDQIQSYQDIVSLSSSNAKKMDQSNHTKACSIIGINTDLIHVNQSQTIKSRITSTNIESHHYLASPNSSEKNNHIQGYSLKQSIELEKINVQEKKQTQFLTQSEYTLKFIQYIPNKLNDSIDSLDQSHSKQKIQFQRDSKFFSETNIQESIKNQITAKSSLNSSNQNKLSVQKKMKENDESKSKSKNKKNANKSNTKILLSSQLGYLKSTKNQRQSEKKTEQKKKMNQKIVKKSIKSQILAQPGKDLLAKTFSPKNQALQKQFRSTFNLPKVVLKSKNSSKESFLTNQTKNIQKQLKKQRFHQNIHISSHTKQKMVDLVKTLSPKARKQGNDGTVRANLLKRIQQKNSINNV